MESLAFWFLPMAVLSLFSTSRSSNKEGPHDHQPPRDLPSMVRWGSWCCESGRCQPENGYFTTPGSHPTTGSVPGSGPSQAPSQAPSNGSASPGHHPALQKPSTRLVLQQELHTGAPRLLVPPALFLEKLLPAALPSYTEMVPPVKWCWGPQKR